MQFGNTGKSAKRNLHRLFSATRGLKRRRSAPLTGPAAARAVEPLECRRLLAASDANQVAYGPTGSWLAVTTMKGEVSVLSRATGKPLGGIWVRDRMIGERFLERFSVPEQSCPPSRKSPAFGPK